MVAGIGPARSVRTRRSTAEQREAVTISKLSDSELLLIFQYLDFTDIIACESVCQHWLGLLRSPSFLWEDYKIKLPDIGAAQRQQLLFLRHRLNAWQDLSLVGDDDTQVDPALFVLLAGASALRNLTIEASVSTSVLSSCCLLSQITYLDLDCIDADQPIGDAELNAVIRGLVSLRSLDFGFRGAAEGAPARPPCSLPTALTFLTKLETLIFTVGKSNTLLRFGALPTWLFSRLSQLTLIQCYNCGVTSIEPGISLLTKLQSLSILHKVGPAGASVCNLSEQVTHCTALSSLELSTGGALPAAAWQLTQLCDLTLDQSRMAAGQLQPVSRLRCLTQLRICNSNVQAALPSLSAPSTLASLLLDGNDLQALPQLGWLPQLSALSLQSNRLSAIPPELRECTKLRCLDLSWNPPLRLSDAATGRDDAALFTEQHALVQLGMRRQEADPWPHADMDSMLKIAACCRPKIICGEGQEHVMDDVTDHLANWVN